MPEALRVILEKEVADVITRGSLIEWNSNFARGLKSKLKKESLC